VDGEQGGFKEKAIAGLGIELGVATGRFGGNRRSIAGAAVAELIEAKVGAHQQGHL
jgi:hypothetical protein